MDSQQNESLPQVTANIAISSKNISGEKIFGWIMLIVGLIIIFVSTFSLYQIFTGNSKPPAVFNTKSPSIKLPGSAIGVDSSQLPSGFPASALNNTSGEVKIVEDDVFNRYLNSGFFYLAMMFVTSSGMKISGIGVSLIKDIKVQVKEEKIKT